MDFDNIRWETTPDTSWYAPGYTGYIGKYKLYVRKVFPELIFVHLVYDDTVVHMFEIWNNDWRRAKQLAVDGMLEYLKETEAARAHCTDLMRAFKNWADEVKKEASRESEKSPAGPVCEKIPKNFGVSLTDENMRAIIHWSPLDENDTNAPGYKAELGDIDGRRHYAILHSYQLYPGRYDISLWAGTTKVNDITFDCDGQVAAMKKGMDLLLDQYRIVEENAKTMSDFLKSKGAKETGS